MALSLDDRLLGEKVHNYCSSSEDEGGEDDSGDERGASAPKAPTFIPEPEINNYPGYSTNTGPKGVLQDWRRFKQLETEKREEQEIERMELAKKLSVSCRSQSDEQREKDKDQQFMEQIQLEMGEFEDEFLKEYRNKRIEEMRRAVQNIPQFGKVYNLSKPEFVECIDREKASVTIVIHVYEDGVKACNAMNGCLQCLAKEYPTVKFCRMRASDAQLSGNFSSRGVPALLVYKNKEMVGNFIALSDDLGDDFFAGDVEGYLVEHGMLPERTFSTAIIRNANVTTQDDSDSDFEVD
ncbi:hypothetical protein CAPTEDRAFT_171124 [Capitella teleta]|uniref:Phosducin domain-containing protein n=1 Tax=Capitella teleta TaxID=283909 RepID=R7VBP5_CAPTE|nr:hypothetical protein CAPTEDRAFT_171124 [Capitella teleta]|eukprot:ELU15987.1 hypothetical protein CAPTEDRAFT_171124 [Capitella teleta]